MREKIAAFILSQNHSVNVNVSTIFRKEYDCFIIFMERKKFNRKTKIEFIIFNPKIHKRSMKLGKNSKPTILGEWLD